MILDCLLSSFDCHFFASASHLSVITSTLPPPLQAEKWKLFIFYPSPDIQVLDHHHLRSRSTRIGDNVIWSLMSCCSSTTTVEKRPCRSSVDQEEINFSGSASGARFDTLSGATAQSMFRTCAHVKWRRTLYCYYCAKDNSWNMDSSILLLGSLQ